MLQPFNPRKWDAPSRSCLVASRMNWRRNSSLYFAQSAMSTHVHPPHRLENTAIITI